jgi:hypothetical protein
MADHDQAIQENRIEDKFVLPKEEFNNVKRIVETHLPAYSHEPNTDYVINRSIYFESPTLTFLKQHLNGMGERRKIRIRTYAPNGVPNHVYFIEIKSKDDGESEKTRVQLSELGFQYAMKHSQIKIDEDLYITNDEVDKDDVTKYANVINYLLTLNKATPIVDINYKRVAFQRDESYRVTMDQDINYRPLRLIPLNIIQDLRSNDLWDEVEDYKTKFSNDENFLLECKYQDDYEKWFKVMIKSLGAEEEGFSKYIWSVSNILDHTLNTIKTGLKK